MLLRVDLPRGALDRDEVRRVTDEVLARPEYRENGEGLLGQIWGFVQELLGRVLEAVVGSGRQTFLGTAVTLVVVGLVVVLLVRFLRGVRHDPGQAPGLGDATGRAPREWLAEAEQHERAGRWREALRCRYRLLLARLAAAGLVDEVPGRTSGEYLAEALSTLPAARDDLRAVTLAFDRVWYGDQPVDGPEVARVAQAVERVDAATRARRGLAVGAGA